MAAHTASAVDCGRSPLTLVTRKCRRSRLHAGHVLGRDHRAAAPGRAPRRQGPRTGGQVDHVLP